MDVCHVFFNDTSICRAVINVFRDGTQTVMNAELDKTINRMQVHLNVSNGSIDLPSGLILHYMIIC